MSKILLRLLYMIPCACSLSMCVYTCKIYVEKDLHMCVYNHICIQFYLWFLLYCLQFKTENCS